MHSWAPYASDNDEQVSHFIRYTKIQTPAKLSSLLPKVVQVVGHVERSALSSPSIYISISLMISCRGGLMIMVQNVARSKQRAEVLNLLK